jgi:NodT family efflux transporter outer membrane factor (OMF) lipoprotein
MKRAIVLLTALLCLGACSMTELDAVPLETRLAYTPEIQARYSRDDQWWRAYNEPQLDALVTTALSRNVDLAKAAVTVSRALYAARYAGADLLPVFSGSGEESFRRQPEFKDDVATAKTYSITGGASWEVDLWMKLRDTATAREWEYRATMQDRDAARLLLIASTADFYFELMYLHSAIGASRSIINIYKQLQQIVDNRFRHGKVSPLEPEQAAQSVLTEERRLYSLQIRQKEVEQGLRLLLNLEPGADLGLTFDKEIGNVSEAVNLGVPLAVLANRPDLKAAEYRLFGAFKDVRAAEKSLYPTVTLSAAIGSSSSTSDTLFDVPFTSGAVLVNLPFLQWNKIRWNIKISQSDYELLKLEFEKKLNTALNEVSIAYSYLLNAEDNMYNAEDRYMRARNISEIYKDQYEHGKRELSYWLEAMNTMWTAWQEVLNYRYQTFRRTNEVCKTMAGRYLEQ